MDRREFIKGGLILMGGLSLPKSLRKKIERLYSPIDKYDLNGFLIDEYDGLLDGTIKYNTELDFSTLDGRGKGQNHGFGIGYRKGNKLITSAHILNVESFMGLPTETTNRKAIFPDGDGELLYYDLNDDVALIEMPKEYGIEFPLGDSDGLEIGTHVAYAGMAYNVDDTVKTSKVISTRGRKGMVLSDKVGNDNVFLLWTTLAPGDSGAPIYAFRDGTPEILGTATAVYKGYNEAHKINNIKSKLKKFIGD